ncbi:MAG: biotin transporter BioY [Clostridiales Family XIII bacterium]|jgi:biotin transport system substrate-specific component|nr:biotin transporter BioY [Clostridiales Family XIII bacterium]
MTKEAWRLNAPHGKKTAKQTKGIPDFMDTRNKTITPGARAAASRNRLYSLILCALFAALTIVGSIIQIPLPFTVVPINLALLSVYLAGGLLGAKYGCLSQAIYILLGAVGLPVFSGFQGGLGTLAGPTGGYIIGYAAAAFVVGAIVGAVKTPPVWKLIGALLAGLIACYTLGTAWFMISAKTTFAAALFLCVIPFLVGDALKITAAVFLIKVLKRTASHFRAF